MEELKDRYKKNHKLMHMHKVYLHNEFVCEPHVMHQTNRSF